MSHLLTFEFKIKETIRESFDTYYSHIPVSQSLISPASACYYAQIRSSIIDWLKLLCSNLFLSNETLFSSIYLLDNYMVEALNPSQEICCIYLTAIACLSLAIKENEVNCNYTNFFAKSILSQLPSQRYSTKDLSLQELKVLKAFGFKLNYANPYHFSLLFLQICFNYCTDLNCFNQVITLNDGILKQFIGMDVYTSMNPIAIAYYAIKESLKQFTNEPIDKPRIRLTIKELLREKNIIPEEVKDKSG